MATRERLGRYRAKRDFGTTGEPDGSDGTPRDEGHFVIRHHAARSDHFDFRLEIDGVLASWAVPKGPSTDPRDRRMARRTEDHPLDYETWLLVKRADEGADARRRPTRTQPESVLTGRTTDQIGKDRPPDG